MTKIRIEEEAVKELTEEEMTAEELALDLRVYGTCYWKMIDGKKVRIHPMDIRYGRDDVPRDSSNTEASYAKRQSTGTKP